jgi:hypothetical protein
MNTILKTIPIFLALALSPAFADDSAMDAEIDYLLATVAKSSCTFIRNGKEHDAGDARDHLQMKRRRGKRYFDSTEEFIERLASKSSWTGKPYRIRCGDEEVDAGDWFTALLTEHRNQLTD